MSASQNAREPNHVHVSRDIADELDASKLVRYRLQCARCVGCVFNSLVHSRCIHTFSCGRTSFELADHAGLLVVVPVYRVGIGDAVCLLQHMPVRRAGSTVHQDVSYTAVLPGCSGARAWGIDMASSSLMVCLDRHKHSHPRRRLRVPWPVPVPECLPPAPHQPHALSSTSQLHKHSVGCEPESGNFMGKHGL